MAGSDLQGEDAGKGQTAGTATPRRPGALQYEDSDEVAPAYRDDLAPGFRHDVAPWAGAAGDGIVGAEPAFVNRPIDLISLVVAALWVCGQRAAVSKLVLQDKRHTHGPYGSALDMADL